MLKRRDADILSKCGERIRFYRIQRGLTQGALGESIDMDFSQFGRIERGETNITLSTLQAIAEALEVEARDLLDF